MFRLIFIHINYSIIISNHKHRESTSTIYSQSFPRINLFIQALILPWLQHKVINNLLQCTINNSIRLAVKKRITMVDSAPIIKHHHWPNSYSRKHFLLPYSLPFFRHFYASIISHSFHKKNFFFVGYKSPLKKGTKQSQQ